MHAASGLQHRAVRGESLQRPPSGTATSHPGKLPSLGPGVTAVSHQQCLPSLHAARSTGGKRFIV